MDNEISTNIKKQEIKNFLFLTIFLAPILTIILVAGLGFSIWITQMLIGLPHG